MYTVFPASVVLITSSVAATVNCFSFAARSSVVSDGLGDFGADVEGASSTAAAAADSIPAASQAGPVAAPPLRFNSRHDWIKDSSSAVTTDSSITSSVASFAKAFHLKKNIPAVSSASSSSPTPGTTRVAIVKTAFPAHPAVSTEQLSFIAFANATAASAGR